MFLLTEFFDEVQILLPNYIWIIPNCQWKKMSWHTLREILGSPLLSLARRGGAHGPCPHSAASLAAPANAVVVELDGVARSSRTSYWSGVSSLVLPLLQPRVAPCRHGRSGSGAGGGVTHPKSSVPGLK